MEEREPCSKTDLKYFMHFISNLKVFNYLFRPHCENYKWYKEIMYHCRDHGKSLCTLWFFVIHSKCLWEGNPSKESAQECITFVKTLMKSITKCDDECNKKQNGRKLSGWLRYYNEQLSSIDKKVINDWMKALNIS